MVSKSANRSLHAAKAGKQDEFYTQCVDIQKEVEAYLEFDPDPEEVAKKLGSASMYCCRLLDAEPRKERNRIAFSGRQ